MVELKFQKPWAGWASIDVIDGIAVLRVTGSHLSDCLRDFIDAVQSLATTHEASCRWEQEPGYIEWKFCRNGSEVELALFDRAHENDEPEQMFRTTVLWRQFAYEVLTNFETLLQDIGAAEYEKEWGYPFPNQACAKLRNALPHPAQQP